jgi:hypothetical protein
LIPFGIPCGSTERDLKTLQEVIINLPSVFYPLTRSAMRIIVMASKGLHDVKVVPDANVLICLERERKLFKLFSGITISCT